MSAATTSKSKLPRLELPVERRQLRCGATLLVSPRPGAPVVAVEAHIRGGHSLDPEGKEGTAHLSGALATEGTSTRSESEIAAQLEPVGGSLSGSASGLAGSAVSSECKLLCDLLADVVANPVYPRREVERQRARLLQRLAIEADDPRTVAARSFRRLVYGNHWLGRNPRGTPESVSTVQRGDLTRHHRRNWLAARAVIGVCGDVNADAIAAHLDRRLGGWKEGKPLEHPAPDLPRRAFRTAAFKATRQQVHLFLGHLGVARDHPDYPALVVMDHVLGTGPGFTDRISRRLRDEQGLAYAVQANIHGSAGVHPGMFTAYIGTAPEKVGLALAGFVREIRRIRDDPVTSEELELVQSYLTGSFVLGYERAARRVQTMIYAERVGLPFDFVAELPRRMAAVTASDVQRVAREHLDPEAFCVAAGGPLDERTLRTTAREALG